MEKFLLDLWKSQELIKKGQVDLYNFGSNNVSLKNGLSKPNLTYSEILGFLSLAKTKLISPSFT
jgi:hypothetical protein